MVNIVKILLHAQSENQPLTSLQCDDVISGYTAANQWSPLTSLRCDVRGCWDVRLRLGLAGSQLVAVISVGRVMLLCWSRIRATTTEPGVSTPHIAT